MHVTSNMLEVVPTSKPGAYGSFEVDEGGEELAKRVENFGHPIGKGSSPSVLNVPRCHIIVLVVKQMTRTYLQSSSARFGRVRSSRYVV